MSNLCADAAEQLASRSVWAAPCTRRPGRPRSAGAASATRRSQKISNVDEHREVLKSNARVGRK